jgi:hypothetical protein
MATTEALEPQLPPVVLATDAKPSRATLAALFARAPRDFGAALVVLFIESFCMFSFFNVSFLLTFATPFALLTQRKGIDVVTH